MLLSKAACRANCAAISPSCFRIPPAQSPFGLGTFRDYLRLTSDEPALEVLIERTFSRCTIWLSDPPEKTRLHGSLYRASRLAQCARIYRTATQATFPTPLGLVVSVDMSVGSCLPRWLLSLRVKERQIAVKKRWQARGIPTETPKRHRCDEVQLCAHALHMKEMFGTAIPVGALSYGIPRGPPAPGPAIQDFVNDGPNLSLVLLRV